MRIRKASKESVGGLFKALYELSMHRANNGQGFVLPINEVGKACKDYQIDFDDVCNIAVAIAVQVGQVSDEDLEQARNGGIR